MLLRKQAIKRLIFNLIQLMLLHFLVKHGNIKTSVYISLKCCITALPDLSQLLT